MTAEDGRGAETPQPKSGTGRGDASHDPRTQTGDGHAETDGAGRRATPPRQVPSADSLGWPGWLLVGLVLVSFLVIPAAIIALPYAQGLLSDLGLGLRDAYLALPMIPAILLAIVAVWAAMRERQH